MVVNLTSVRFHFRSTTDADLNQCPGSSIIQPIYICSLFTLPISRFPDFSDHLVMTLYYLYVYYASAMQNLCYYFYRAPISSRSGKPVALSRIQHIHPRSPTILLRPHCGLKPSCPSSDVTATLYSSDITPKTQFQPCRRSH